VDPEAYVDQLLAEAVVNNIQVLGITDHNDVSSVDRIAARAKERGIVVFPGFEVMSSEGIHVLCLFDPGTTEADLRPHLYGLGVKTVGPSSDLCECTFVQVLEHIANRGGICIAAHVVHHNGLLYETSGKARIANWRSPHLLAVQIPGRVDDLGPDYKQIITNVDPEHKRYPARGRSLAVAVINAKDVKTPSDLAHQAATTFIKMTIPSVEGLRQAFLDPDSRIRLNGQEIPETRADIVAVSWEAGFLDGCGVHFNENLNVLIGGRGAGKSSVIESIRWALGVEPLGDEAKKQHESMLKHVVPSGTKVSILVRTREPDEKHYVIERSAPNPPVVRDAATGQISNLTPHRVLRADIFGQHELSELSGSKEHLTRLLDRFVQPDPQLTARKSDVRRRLEASRRQTMAVTKELLDIGERLATLPSLEETLKRYQDAGVESRLMEQGVLVREERVLTTADERLGRFDEMIADLGRELPLDTLFLSDRALADLPGKEILAGARQAMDTMSTGAMTAHKTLTKALADARNQMASVRAAWKVRKEGAQKAYEKALRELQQSRIDGAQYVELKRNLENLRPLVERKSALERDLRELRQNRADLALEWEDLKRSEFQRLQKAAKAIGRKLDQGVAVDVNFGGKRTPLIQLLSKRINNFSSAAKATLDRDGMSLTELSASCRAGKIEVEKRFNLSPVMAERIAELGEELAMEIEELELPTTTSVSLNVAPLGQPINLRPLEELSAGQRATALLLIVLLESDGPLIVDQPEDDLDNRFITEGVVPRMKDEKRRRQFIFATHNANIPVLADAELIIGLSARARSAEMSPDLMGSIDTKAVRSLVETQLEGGKEAFELRRLKYGYQNA
jgi:DNA repair ATPase RecN